MKKKLVIAFALLVLLTTYKPHKFFLTTKLNIKLIEIENNFILTKEDLRKNLFFLYDTNLFFLNTSSVENVLKNIDLIESFEIKKIYPNKIKIRISEKKPVAIIEYKKKKFYISEKMELIDYLDLKYFKDLPTVFGNQENFEKLYKNLKKINFPIESIKKYYLYELKRWDIETYKKQIIKLPSNNYIKSLENFMTLAKENNFDKYKVFDYRINNQLILK